MNEADTTKLTTDTATMEPTNAIAAARAFCEDLLGMLEREIHGGKFPAWSISRPIIRDRAAEQRGSNGCTCWKSEGLITVIIDLDRITPPANELLTEAAAMESQLTGLEQRLVEQLESTTATGDEYVRTLLKWYCMVKPFGGDWAGKEVVEPARAARNAVQDGAIALLKALEVRGFLADEANKTIDSMVGARLAKATEAATAPPTVTPHESAAAPFDLDDEDRLPPAGKVWETGGPSLSGLLKEQSKSDKSYT